MVPCGSTTIGRGLVPSRAYDGSEYHISYADFICRARMRWEVRDRRVGVAGCDW